MTEPTNKTGYDSFDKYVCPVMFVAAKSPVLSRSHELKTILHNPILRYLLYVFTSVSVDYFIPSGKHNILLNFEHI